MYKTIHTLSIILLSLSAATSCQSDKPGRLKTKTSAYKKYYILLGKVIRIRRASNMY